MNNTADVTFRTKTGTCTITSEQIILTREGTRGAFAQWALGNSIGRILLVYGLLGGSALAFGISSLLRGGMVEGVLLSVVGAYFLWGVFSSRHNSAAPILNRSAIRTVEAHPPRPPATRGYFAISFEEDGKMRKRLIILPGMLENGSEEYVRAESALRASGLLPTE